MTRKELKKAYKEADSELVKKQLLNDYWESHAWVKLFTISILFLIIMFILWLGFWLLLKLIKFIAF